MKDSEIIEEFATIIDAIVFVVIGITYIFYRRQLRNLLTNFNVILYMASLFYAWNGY